MAENSDLNELSALTLHSLNSCLATTRRMMRILIEVIVNTHVFNRRRQQFKQRRQNASVFTDCVKSFHWRSPKQTVFGTSTAS